MSKGYPENIPHHYYTITIRNNWCKVEWIHVFMLFTSNSHLSQSRCEFSFVLMFLFGELVALLSCSQLTGTTASIVFCCCSPSATGFNVLCGQRLYSADLGCCKWVFVLPLAFYHHVPVCLLLFKLWCDQRFFCPSDCLFFNVFNHCLVKSALNPKYCLPFSYTVYPTRSNVHLQFSVLPWISTLWLAFSI